MHQFMLNAASDGRGRSAKIPTRFLQGLHRAYTGLTQPAGPENCLAGYLSVSSLRVGADCYSVLRLQLPM